MKQHRDRIQPVVKRVDLSVGSESQTLVQGSCHESHLLPENKKPARQVRIETV